MKQREIQERNKQIALMLGYINTTPTDKDFNIFENKEKPFSAIPKMIETRSMEFHSDWNWLMESVEFIKKNIRSSSNTSDAKIGEYFIDEWEFKVKKFYIRFIQWTDKGWRMFDKENKDLSILYIIGENCQSEKEAIFLAVSDFAKLYNENKFGRLKNY